MNANKDDNSVSTIIAVLDTDGTTIVPIEADPSSHRLAVADGSGGSDNGPENANKDENGVSTFLAVSNVDGVTPVAVYADSNGKLLIQST